MNQSKVGNIFNDLDNLPRWTHKTHINTCWGLLVLAKTFIEKLRSDNSLKIW